MLLKDLNEHRIYIAHELLADDALMKKLAGWKAQRFAWKSLERGLYAVETVILVHDFLATIPARYFVRTPASETTRKWLAE